MSLLTKGYTCPGTGCSSRAFTPLHASSTCTVRQAHLRTSAQLGSYNIPVQRNAVLAGSGLSTEPELQGTTRQLSSNSVIFQDQQQLHTQQQELLQDNTHDGTFVSQPHDPAPGPPAAASLAESTAATSAVNQAGTEHALHLTSSTAEERHELNATDAATPGTAGAAAAAPASNSSSYTPPPGGFFSFYSTDVHDHPTPVQLPPPGATTDPPEHLPAFAKSKYMSPAFLKTFPVPEGQAFNYLSFLGALDWHGGKYYVRQHALEDFLQAYWKMVVLKKRKMHIAESYQGQPYKFFQELDFAWSLDVQLVLQLIPKVVQIVTEEACRAHRVPEPYHIQPLISMRTPYKVHLNFPDIFTVEATVRSVRKRVINRCRQELSGLPPLQLLKEERQLQQQVLEAQQALQQLPQPLQEEVMQKWHRSEGDAGQLLLSQLQLLGVDEESSPATATLQEDLTAAAAAGIVPQKQRELDWESIIDFPHGSLRLLGSCKAPWMDSDPAWVTEKCYSRVECVGGVWMRQPLSFASVMSCSILLNAMELRVYEQSEDFLESAYQAVDSREQMLAAKRLIRYCNRELKRFQQLQQPDGDSAAAAAAVVKEHTAAVKEDAAVVKKDTMPRQQQANTLKHKRTKAELHVLQRQQQAAEEQERQRKKAAALARLKAAAASTAQQQQQHPAGIQLVRPAGAVSPTSLGLAAVSPAQQQEVDLPAQQQQQPPRQSMEQSALSKGHQQQQQAAAAAAEHDQQSKKQEALAKLQALQAAGARQQQQQLGLLAPKSPWGKAAVQQPSPQQQQ